MPTEEPEEEGIFWTSAICGSLQCFSSLQTLISGGSWAALVREFCGVGSCAGNEWYHPQPPARPLGRIWRCKGAEDPFKSCSQRGVPLQVGAPLGMSCSRIHSTTST